MTCGAEKFITGVKEPLLCEREPDHKPPHMIFGIAGLPLGRWPVEWTAEDEAEYRTRFATWRKPHVRREYQTLSMWKARQK
jgi:hypothetical protein